MPHTWEQIKDKNYLGDYKVVSTLVRTFAKQVLSEDKGDFDKFKAHVEKEAKRLADIFLGKDAKYPGPPWFSDNQLGANISKESGVTGANAEENVMGALVSMISRIYRLMEAKDEYIQAKTDIILNQTTNMLMGIPKDTLLKPAKKSLDQKLNERM